MYSLMNSRMTCAAGRSCSRHILRNSSRSSRSTRIRIPAFFSFMAPSVAFGYTSSQVEIPLGVEIIRNFASGRFAAYERLSRRSWSGSFVGGFSLFKKGLTVVIKDVFNDQIGLQGIFGMNCVKVVFVQINFSTLLQWHRLLTVTNVCYQRYESGSSANCGGRKSMKLLVNNNLGCFKLWITI